MKVVDLLKNLIIVVFAILVLAGCKDDVPAGCDGQDPVNFISLAAALDTIETGGSTVVTATAKGYDLSFIWTATKGYIFPGESENIITYTASPCAIGEITITCEATDACENSETKNIIIVVL